MDSKLKVFLEKPAEVIFEWKDPLSDARGWTVINSLKGGAAGGGTRMRKGLSREEVFNLAKTMEIKFNVCGPAIGGAKSGIDFDHKDPRKSEVLRRWFAALKPLLENYYGTAGDLNVDERFEVSPSLRELGIEHPQFGVLKGHYKYDKQQQIEVLKNLKMGTELKVKSPALSPLPGTDTYSTTDLITGFGLFESVRQYYKLFKNETLEGKRVAIQGWGNVGAAAGWYLAKEGAQLVWIQDIEGFISNANGYSMEEVGQFMNQKKNNCVPSMEKSEFTVNKKLFADLKIDVFLPAAASKLVGAELLDCFLDNGLELISSGANVPFKEDELFYGALTKQTDQRIALIPDFIANCGVARLFSYLLNHNGPVNEEAIFEDISNTISASLLKLREGDNAAIGITGRALNYFC